jgi:hypothetical protein
MQPHTAASFGESTKATAGYATPLEHPLPYSGQDGRTTISLSICTDFRWHSNCFGGNTVSA